MKWLKNIKTYLFWLLITIIVDGNIFWSLITVIVDGNIFWSLITVIDDGNCFRSLITVIDDGNCFRLRITIIDDQNFFAVTNNHYRWLEFFLVTNNHYRWRKLFWQNRCWKEIVALRGMLFHSYTHVYTYLYSNLLQDRNTFTTGWCTIQDRHPFNATIPLGLASPGFSVPCSHSRYSIVQ